MENKKNTLAIPLIIIFFLMVVMVFYTSQNVRSVTVSNIHEVGYDKLTSVRSQIENYLDTTKGMLWVTASTVDYMVRNDQPTEAIQQYLVEQTNEQIATFNFDYTGLYGYVGGEYLDGLNWVPVFFGRMMHVLNMTAQTARHARISTQTTMMIMRSTVSIMSLRIPGGFQSRVVYRFLRDARLFGRALRRVLQGQASVAVSGYSRERFRQAGAGGG